MALERQNILEAALELLNSHGIDQLTTRRLAERLGVQQPALYWHFRNKAALLDALNELIMQRGHTRRAPKRNETWQRFVAENARSFRRSLLSARDGARVHAGTKPAISDLAGAEAQLQLYVDAGFDTQTALEAGIAIGRYVVGCVLEEQADDERPGDPDALKDAFGKYPLMYETICAHFGQDQAKANERAFEGGLALIIAGLEAKLAARRTRAAGARRRPAGPK